MLNVKYNEFYKYQEIEDFLFEAQEEYKKFISIETLTETPEGRKVYLAVITDSETGPAEQKGAYYIQACVHAQEGAGTTAALYIIKMLLEDNKNRDLLKKVAFYIIPRVNPDGTEYAVTKRGAIRSRFKDNYGKNRLVPKDINGDGYVLSMRWEDPLGPMKEDEVDPRIMVRRQPGDKGPFYQVITEGMIEEFEHTALNPKEIKNQRPVDFNRNWPINWSHKTPESSLYPFSEPEMRAVGEFMLNHPNIFAGIDIHCGTNGILRPAMKPDSEMDQEDLGLILNIGKMAENITGFPLIHEREYKEPWRQPVTLHGNSNDWSYFKMGTSHYVVELGNGFNCAGISAKEYFSADPVTRETIFMRKVLKHHDDNGSSIFVPWEDYQHPQLGKVQIGGLTSSYGYYMYPAVMENIAPKVAEFAVYHAKKHPELAISNIEVVRVDDNTDETSVNMGIYRIRASIANIGGFCTKVMKSGGSPDTNYPIVVKLIIPEGGFILSQVKTFEISKLNALGDSQVLEWFVTIPVQQIGGTKKTMIRANHPRAGVCTKEVLIK